MVKNRVGDRVSSRLQSAKVARNCKLLEKPTVSPVLVQNQPHLQVEPCDEDDVPISELFKRPSTVKKPTISRGKGIQVRHAILI